MALFNACPLVVLRALLRVIACLSSGSIVSKDSSMSIGALTIRIDVLILASEAKMLVSIRFPSLSTTRILYCCGLTVCQASICVCDAVSDTSGTMVTSFEDSSILYQSNYTNSRGTAHTERHDPTPPFFVGYLLSSPHVLHTPNSSSPRIGSYSSTLGWLLEYLLNLMLNLRRGISSIAFDIFLINCIASKVPGDSTPGYSSLKVDTYVDGCFMTHPDRLFIG